MCLRLVCIPPYYPLSFVVYARSFYSLFSFIASEQLLCDFLRSSKVVHIVCATLIVICF